MQGTTDPADRNGGYDQDIIKASGMCMSPQLISRRSKNRPKHSFSEKSIPDIFSDSQAEI